MGVDLPALSRRAFNEALSAAIEAALPDDEVLARLFTHYGLLREWAARMALIGRGTVQDAVCRHYAESLAALPLLGSCRRLVDIGSGAGFPGWVLAAARQDIEVWLVDSNSRKAVFLRTASSKAALSCRVLGARVSALLPPEFPSSVDLVTVRATRLSAREWSALEGRLACSGRLLRWVGPSAPRPPRGWEAARRVRIAGSGRAIEELVRVRSTEPAP